MMAWYWQGHDGGVATWLWIAWMVLFWGGLLAAGVSFIRRRPTHVDAGPPAEDDPAHPGRGRRVAGNARPRPGSAAARASPSLPVPLDVQGRARLEPRPMLGSRPTGARRAMDEPTWVQPELTIGQLAAQRRGRLFAPALRRRRRTGGRPSLAPPPRSRASDLLIGRLPAEFLLCRSR
jgi:hypothetical protein